MTKKSALLLLVLAGQNCRTSAPPAPPNILYIMTDDHAASMMSAYDSSRASTPNLDRIAREGMIFRNAFCTNSLCGPSRATVLTGLYSHLNGVRANGDVFDGRQTTFPQLLQGAGYQTALVGKWHLTSDPTGFDYWNILPGQGDYINPSLIEMGREETHQGYVTDIITDIAIDWIKRRDQGRPFALLLHHKAPHAPWVPDPRYKSLFEDEDVPKPPTFDDTWSGRAEPILKAANRLVPDLLSRYRAWEKNFDKTPPPAELEGDALRTWMYQAFIKDYKRVMVSVDENVGRLLDFLNSEGLTRNTLVIYTSDNGKFVGDHFMFDKRLMYEEPLHVPLAIRFPDRIAAGQTNSSLVLNLDYAPTILDYAGVEIPATMQGSSLRPLLEGHPPLDWRDSIYYEYLHPPAAHNIATHYGVRTDRFKLIHYHGDYGGPPAWELIDLQKDPFEYQNVYQDPAYSETVTDLKAELETLRRRFQVKD